MKLLKTLGFTFIVSIIVVIISYYGFVSPILIEQEAERTIVDYKKNLDLIDDYLSEYVDTIESDIEYVLLNDQISTLEMDLTTYVDATNDFNYNPTQEELDLIQFLEEFGLSKDYVISISVADLNGGYVSDSYLYTFGETPFDYDPRLEEWFIEASLTPSEYGVSRLYQDHNNDGIYVLVSKAILDDVDNVIGVVSFELDFIEITRYLGTINSNDDIIVGLIQDEKKITYNAGEVIFDEIAIDLNEQISQSIDDNDQYFNYRDDNVSYYIVGMGSDYVNFDYFLQIPSNFIVSRTSGDMINYIIVILIMISFLFVSLYILLRTIIEVPLSKLNDTTKKMIDINDKMIRVDTKDLHVMAPIGIEINKLVDVLRQNQSKLQDSVDESLIELNLLKVAIEQSPSSIIITDSYGQIAYVNKQTTTNTGYSADELIGKTPRVFNSGKHSSEFFADLWKTILSGETFRSEVCNKRKDGSLIWEDIFIAPVTNKVGDILNFISIRFDITEKREQRLEISRSQALLQEFLDSAPIGLNLFSKEGDLIQSNSISESILGISVDDQKKKNTGRTWKIITPDGKDFPFEEHPATRALAGEKLITDIEMGIVKEHNKITWLSVNASSIDEEVGGGAALAFMDITEQKKVNEELIKAREEIEAFYVKSDNALDLTKAGYWTIDFNDTEHYISSERTADILGEEHKPDFKYNLETEWLSRMREADEKIAEEAGTIFQNALSGENPIYDATYKYKRPKDGVVIWTRAIGSIIRNEDGTPKIMYGVQRDITQQKEAEKNLEEARLIAEKATQSKSDFLANMSHEIRTPMNAIIGLNDLLSYSELNEKQLNYVDKVGLASRNLLGILNDILDFSKIEAGKLTIERIEFSIDNVITNISNIISAKHDNSDVEISIIRHKNVPKFLKGDPLRLNQIITNLMNNSLKFTKTGEIILDILVIEENDGDIVVRFSVEDTGIGMTEEQIAKLFQAFTQADTSITRKYGGTGLGLTITKTLVDLMGGTIEVTSEYGIGTKFIVELPFKNTSNDSEIIFVPEEINDINVAIVEENKSAMEVYKMYMDHLKFTTNYFYSPEEFLASIKLDYDLVIMNYHFDELTGDELWSKYSKARRDKTIPKLILVLSNDNELLKYKSVIEKYPNKLTKPITSSELFDSIINTVVDQPSKISSRQRLANTELLMRKGSNILLVEDNEVNQLVVLDTLAEYGLNIIVAHNGLEAVEKVYNGEIDFDLILMDLQMPVMDGYQATKKIREKFDEKKLPIIALSADVLAETVAKISKVGIQSHVGKPINFNELIRVLNSYLPKKIQSTNVYKNQSNIENIDYHFDKYLLEFDYNSAIERLLGQEDKYIKLLTSFASRYSNYEGMIDEIIERDDGKELTRFFHSLKGLAGNIGQIKLSKLASTLEIKTKQKDFDSADMSEDIDMFNIKSILEKSILQINTLNQHTKKDIDLDFKSKKSIEELKREISHLITLLQEYDVKAIHTFEELENEINYHYSEEQSIKLKKLIVGYQNEDALEILDTLIKEVKTSE